MLEKTPGVVDIDWYVEDPPPEMLFHFDRLKASMAGVSIAEAQQAVALGIGGSQAGLLHDGAEAEDVPLKLRLPLGEADFFEPLSLRGSGVSMNLKGLKTLRIIPMQKILLWLISPATMKGEKCWSAGVSTKTCLNSTQPRSTPAITA